MEEKIQDKKNREALNPPVEHILRLPIEVVFPRTTAMGIRWIHQSYAQQMTHTLGYSNLHQRKWSGRSLLYGARVHALPCH